ncbi:protein CUSTOS isoform X2 [Sphaeramia orbicularis]|uniref:protein CUSTOS isoform X2 n=1 Tax=Sphaeramia orbicularis TaxID=375764 RepID=UPI00118029BF|nr:protein CUSTOS isoform X2 [Sphaeramia orbicularis]
MSGGSVGSTTPQDKRIVVAEHEHDGNELQVTRGFQTHVAKKLDHLLDSLISEKQPETSTCVELAKCGDDDEGFRLFSTSVPGQAAEEPPAPVRRRPIPSSSDSDSDMETRLKEAAVSIKDLLPAFLLPATESKEEIPSTEKRKKKKKKKKVEEGEENHIVKKKKKLNQEVTEKVDSESAHNGQNSGDHNDSDNAQTQVKVKKKKKKRKSTEANTEGEVVS